MLPSDSQVQPLIQVFGLYMLRDAALTDMWEPTVVATRVSYVITSGHGSWENASIRLVRMVKFRRQIERRQGWRGRVG